MPTSPIGVAVIGAGMAGRSHAYAYRAATTVFDDRLPPVRLVAIADTNEHFATDAAHRYGFARAETRWQAIAAADDIDAVSVVVANSLHREIVEGLLAAGKHVLCEKPLAGTLAEAEAMVDAAARSDRVNAVGYTFRRSPAIGAIREQLRPGSLGTPLHFNGHYWCDYGCDPRAPISWRYRGGPGSGALGDIGSHLIDLAEYLCGPIEAVSGATLRTVVTERPVPLAAALGHAMVEVGQETEPVDNEDIAGQAAGEQLNTMGVKHMLCVVQAQGQVQLEARCAGAQKTFKGTSDKLYVEGTSMPDVRSKVTASLQTDKSIDAVLTLGAPIALTAVQSVKDAASSAKVVTFDMNPELVTALKAGDVEFAIDQQPYLQGYLGVDALWLYKANGDILGGGKPVLTGPAIVTRDTVAQIEEFAKRGTR